MNEQLLILIIALFFVVFSYELKNSFVRIIGSIIGLILSIYSFISPIFINIQFSLALSSIFLISFLYFFINGILLAYNTKKDKQAEAERDEFYE
jgi:predicted membrane protein